MEAGKLSQATGTSIGTIRYYERIGLLPDADQLLHHIHDAIV